MRIRLFGKGVAMARKKYGIMPDRPQLIARIRGDAGEYPVLGMDWRFNRVMIFRASELEWIPIEKVALEDAPEQ